MEIKNKALILPYNNNNEILIQDRSNIKKEINMKWGYFGGGIEEGESPVQAVIRETKEELGIDIFEKDLEFVGVFIDEPLPNIKVIRNAYLWKMKIGIENFNLQEGKAMKLVKVSELVKYMLTQGDKELALTTNKIINLK